MGMIISDGAKMVSTLGEKSIHVFDGTTWKVLPKTYDD
jgi:hypothetical protein